MGTINFQGKVVRDSGLNVSSSETTCIQSGTDTCGFQMAYYSAPSGGTLLGTETFTNVEIGDYGGVVNFALGTGSFSAGSESSFANIFANNNAVYAELRFDHNGNASYTEVFGRIAVRGAAFAMRSSDSAALGGRSSTGYVQLAPGSVQTDSSTSSSIFINKTGGSGNILQLQRSGSDVLVLNNEGTNMTVQGSIYAVSSAIKLFYNTGLSINTIDFYGDGGVSTSNNGDLYLSPDGTGDVLISNGRLGVGVAIPTQALDISGSIALENTTSSTTGVIYKGSDRFIHNYKHPTGGGAIPVGDNTFVGVRAGNFSMGSTATETYHSSYNVGIGVDALSSLTTGGFNVAIGNNALYSITSGSNNFGLGFNAGRYLADGSSPNELGSNNMYIGYNTKSYSSWQVNEIVIGYNATGAGSNSVVLGNDSITKTVLRGSVGIGTEDPAAALSVGSTSQFQVNTSGAIAAATGITSSGTITFSGLSTDGIVTVSSGVLGSMTGSFVYFTPSSAQVDDTANSSIFIDKTGSSGNILQFQKDSTDVLVLNNDGLLNVVNDALVAGLTLGKGGSSFTYNTILGTQALANTTGDHNTAIGYTSLYSNVGNTRSTAIGDRAMYYADNRATGRDTFNTALGYEALRGSTTASNNTGQYNTAIGDSALFANRSGYSNVALGYRSLYNNTTGYYNVAVGDSSLYFNAINYRSVAIGYRAMYYADSRTVTPIETRNVAIGSEALRGSTSPTSNTGTMNVAIGDSALFSNAGGGSNVAIGYQSMYNNLSSGNNVAVGVSTLFSNTTGLWNLAVGPSALYSNTTGGNNLSIGYNSLYSNVANHRSIAIGFNAMRYADNRSSGRQTYNLALGYEALRGSTSAASNTGQYNVAIGDSVLFANTSGSYNVGLGVNALDSNTSGASNIAIGYAAGENITTGSTNIMIGYDIDAQSATGSNQLSIGNVIFATGGFGTGTSVGSGDVGIGEASPSARLHVIKSGSEQVRIGSDTSNYYSTTVSATGVVTFDAVGSGSSFVFSDDVLPSSDDTLSLGSSSYRWKDVYVGPGTIRIGTGASEGTIGYNTQEERLEFSASNLQFIGDANVRSLTVESGTGTDDRIRVVPAQVGGARFDGTITNVDLTQARTWSLQNADGVIALGTSSNSLFFTTTGATNVTLPTSGTLATTGDIPSLVRTDSTTNPAAVGYTGTTSTAGYLYGGSTAPTGTTYNLNYAGRFRATELYEGSTRVLTADQYVGTVTSVSAGNGMDFTTITESGSVTLGTPDSITSTSTNSVTATSHSHALSDQSVTYAKIQNVDAYSVIGRSASTAGVSASISAGSDHQVLRRSGTSIGFGAINLAQSAAVTGTLGATNGGTGQNTVTTGDLLYGSGSNTWGKLAGVATGNALISGGAGVAPSWGKVELGTHTTGAYVTAEADTLATVTGRGASTSTATTFSGGLTSNGTFTLGTGNNFTKGSGAGTFSFTTTTAINGISLSNTGVATSTNANINMTVGATTGRGLQLTGNSITSGTAIYASSSSLTTGSIITLQQTGTTAVNNSSALRIDVSGANSVSLRASSGIAVSNTRTGTNNTNYGARFFAGYGETNVGATFHSGVGLADETTNIGAQFFATGDTFSIGVIGAEFLALGPGQSVKAATFSASGGLYNTAIEVTNGNVWLGSSSALTVGGGITNNHTTLATRMATTSSAATQIPVFIADPASTTRTLVTRTPVQLRGDIGAAATNQTMYLGTTAVAINRASGALTLSNVSTSFATNAGTASNAVNAGTASWADGASYVTNGVYTSGNQTIGGSKSFTDHLYIGSAASSTNDLYIADRILDWDDSSYYLDLNSSSKVHTFTLTGNLYIVKDNPRIYFQDDSTTTPRVNDYDQSNQRIRWYKEGGSEGTREFMKLEAYNSGDLYTDGGMYANNWDLAENTYHIDHNSATPGDVVSVVQSNKLNIPEKKVAVNSSYVPNDEKLVGVISTNPSLVMGSGGLNGDYDVSENVQVALSGRVPVKVFTKVGSSLQIGDKMTSSYLPTYATKTKKAGNILGTLMEDTNDWNDTKCPLVTSLAAINWPTDDGTNATKACFKIPVANIENNAEIMNEYNLTESDHLYVGKVILFINVSWYNPNPILDTGILNVMLSDYESGILGGSYNGDLTATSVTTTSLFSTSATFTTLVVGTGFNVSSGGDLSIAGDIFLGDIKISSDQDTIFIKSKVSVDELIAKKVITGLLQIDKTDEDSAAVGNDVLIAGEREVRIDTNAVTKDSYVLITPQTELSDPSLNPYIFVKEKNDGYFIVSINMALDDDFVFDWFIIR